VIDLGSAMLLPGFIDMHSHPLQSTDSYQVDHLRWSSAYKALKFVMIGGQVVKRP
jgi:predicted amidohydrolase YtcJ